jgi:hypothetical protein
MPPSIAGLSQDSTAGTGPGRTHHDLLGVTPPGQDPAKAAPDRSPKFFADERALEAATRTMASLAVNCLSAEPKEKESLRPSRPFVQEDRYRYAPPVAAYNKKARRISRLPGVRLDDWGRRCVPNDRSNS